MKFHGDFEDLQILVCQLGYQGEWEDRGNNKVFRSVDGAVLNWWRSTKTIQIQGPQEVRSTLSDAISSALEDEAASPPSTAPTAVQGNDPQSAPNTDTLKSSTDTESNRVFVVHGHDDTAREQLELILHRLNLKPFVLANTSGDGLTIIEALEKEISASKTGKRFGIVLLTPDDMGYRQDTNPPEAPEPRARQNVVMEMGMLIAAFGRPQVAILKKGHVVVPSDAHGIIYFPFNNHVKETVPLLCERLRKAGFELDPSLINQAAV